MLSWVVNSRLHQRKICPRRAGRPLHLRQLDESPACPDRVAGTNHESPVTSHESLSPFLSYSSELFCTHQKLNPFVFMRFRTLCQKLPGVGYPSPRELFTRGSLH